MERRRCVRNGLSPLTLNLVDSILLSHIDVVIVFFVLRQHLFIVSVVSTTSFIQKMDIIINDLPAIASEDNSNSNGPQPEPHPEPKPKKQRARSEESKLRQSGIHPQFNLRVVDCLCGQKECRQIMWRWANINAGYMFPYPILPTVQAKETDKAKHHQVYRDLVIDHFCGKSCDPKKRQNKKINVALWHYPPEFRTYIRDFKGQKMINRWRVPLPVGKRLLSENEQYLCQTKDEAGNQTYYAFPIRNDVSIARMEVEVAEKEYHSTQKIEIDTPEPNPSPKPSTPTTRSKTHAQTSALELRKAKATLQARSDPAAFAEQFIELEDKLEAAKKEIRKLELDLNTRKLGMSGKRKSCDE